MAELLLLVTAAVVLISMLIAYAQSGDALHPLMFLGPMLMYVYVVKPWLVISNGALNAYLTAGQVEFAETLFLAGISALCLGMLCGSGSRRGRVWIEVTPELRRRMVRLGAVLGMLSLAGYWTGIFMSGGFFRVYSHTKGMYSAGSGWVNELVNLSIPASALFLLAWQGQRRYRHYLGWVVVFASPLLIHGFLGSRRGPTFMILAAGAVAWYIRRGKRVSLWKVVTSFGLIGAVVLFLVAHRSEISLGGDVDFSVAKFWERVAPREVDTTDDTVFMYGFVNGVSDAGQCYWGKRYFATYFVRPIPRQLWPTKYEDLGVGWMVRQSEFAGISDAKWEESLGWVPARGAAVGFAGDLFLEVGWLGLMACFAIGWFYGRMWRNASRWGGMWTLLYVEAAALSIYLPTQSVSAVFHRFLFMALPTVILWRAWIASKERRTAGRGGQTRAIIVPRAGDVMASSIVK